MAVNIDVKQVVYDIEQRLDAILLAEFGNDAVLIGGDFDEKEMKLKISIRFKVKFDFESQDLREQFERFAPDLGLRASDFDLELVFHGKPATLVEITPSRLKYPFVIESHTGTRFRVKPEIFKLARVKAQQAAAAWSPSQYNQDD